MKRSNVLTGSHPKHGTLWVAFDAAVHHVTGRVTESRFSARLAPFRSRAEAQAALIAAGCAPERVSA